MLNIGVNVNLNNGDRIFLLVVCEGGYLNIVEELVLEGVDVDLNKRSKIL